MFNFIQMFIYILLIGQISLTIINKFNVKCIYLYMLRIKRYLY